MFGFRNGATTPRRSQYLTIPHQSTTCRIGRQEGMQAIRWIQSLGHFVGSGMLNSSKTQRCFDVLFHSGLDCVAVSQEN
jgi:hypothetical protein